MFEEYKMYKFQTADLISSAQLQSSSSEEVWPNAKFIDLSETWGYLVRKEVCFTVLMFI